MDREVTIYSIPETPVSLNNAYPQKKGGGRVLSKAARKLKQALVREMWVIDKKLGRRLPLYEYYNCHFIFWFPEESFFTRAGKPRKFDVFNLVKLPEDCVFQFMREVIEGAVSEYVGPQPDDCRSLTVVGCKRPYNRDRCLIQICVSEARLEDPFWINGQCFDQHEILEIGHATDR